ncbi:unnamed protein product [Prunus armeniaca]
MQMSNLIRSRKAVTTAQSSPLPAQPSVATALAQMDHLPVGPGSPMRWRHQHHQWRNLLAPGIITAPLAPSTQHQQTLLVHWGHNQLKTAKVTRVTNSRINIGYNKWHWAAPTAELHSSLAHDIGHVVRTHCPIKWKSWKVMPEEMRMEDLDDESLAYVNRLFAERYKQWKSDLHHHFQAFDDPQVALQEGCPKKLEGREDSWGGSKFPEIDVFGDVYVQPGNELAEFLHDAGFQILTETLDQTLGRRPGTYFRGMGNARWQEPRPRSSSQSNEVTALTTTVAELKGQMSVLLEFLVRFGIPIPHFGPSSTFEPLQLEHGHQTSALVDIV